MKNDTFSLSRFGKYLLSDLSNAYQNAGIAITLASCTGILTYLIVGLMSLIMEGEWTSINLSSRLCIFGICLAILSITIPVKCYGGITDKKTGTAFLTLPASIPEKFISMILISCLIVPAVYMLVFFGLDRILCALDKGCGTAIMSISMREILNNVDLPDSNTGMEQLLNPFLFYDDIVSFILFFLLGALYFKRSKIGKTAGCIFLFILAATAIAVPIFKDRIMDIDYIEKMFSHIALWDTLSDSIVNLAALALIYLRLRTIKH